MTDTVNPSAEIATKSYLMKKKNIIRCNNVVDGNIYMLENVWDWDLAKEFLSSFCLI